MTIFLCVSSIPIPPVSLFSSLCSLWSFIPSLLRLFPALERGFFSLTKMWEKPTSMPNTYEIKKKIPQVTSVAQAISQSLAVFVESVVDQRPNGSCIDSTSKKTAL